MEYDSAIKLKEVLTQATTWMKLENILRSQETNRCKKQTYGPRGQGKRAGMNWEIVTDKYTLLILILWIK